ncbi:MAG: DUF1223 domain-containing protein [Imperialibacter sp.]
MKKWTIAAGVVLATGLAAFLSPKPFIEKMALISEPNDRAFAVIELFTSQGCSSCPAADQLLNSIIEQAAINGDPVFGLSFHVSYWDYLGWKDPYASSTYNVRQGNYVNQLKAGNAYTPQMVVNGKTEFVGSSRKEADEAIKTALSEPASYSLKASAAENGGELTVKYALGKAPDQTLINFALVKKEAENQVPRGENKGRTLTHKNVVVAFQTVAAEAAGEVSLLLPKEFEAEDSSVIIYLQNKNDLAIIAACQVIL